MELKLDLFYSNLVAQEGVRGVTIEVLDIERPYSKRSMLNILTLVELFAFMLDLLTRYMA